MRSDSIVLTKPFLEKIDKLISDSDIIVADCSGRNPNVMYELGIAHARKKKVILITKDKSESFPSDIKHFDFIIYTENEIDFLKKLDNALNNVLIERYEKLHIKAVKIYTKFTSITKNNVIIASKEIFIERVKLAEESEGIPKLGNKILIERFLLPRIIKNSGDLAVAKEINSYLAI